MPSRAFTFLLPHPLVLLAKLEERYVVTMVSLAKPNPSDNKGIVEATNVRSLFSRTEARKEQNKPDWDERNSM
jgi:hypothetical protein